MAVMKEDKEQPKSYTASGNVHNYNHSEKTCSFSIKAEHMHAHLSHNSTSKYIVVEIHTIETVNIFTQTHVQECWKYCKYPLTLGNG